MRQRFSGLPYPWILINIDKDDSFLSAPCFAYSGLLVSEPVLFNLSLLSTRRTTRSTLMMNDLLHNSHYTEQTRTYVQNLIDFFESSKDDQQLRSTYISGIEPSTRLAAVLILLFEKDGVLRVLVTTRGKNLKTHGGQTSLPGGKMEDADNRDIFATAYREANEEVSLPLNCPHIHTLGTLDLQPFHNLVVTPVVALLTNTSILDELKPRKGEVDHIFSHPVEAFSNPDLAPKLETLVPHGSNNWPHQSKYHYYKDYVFESLGGISYRLHHFQTSASPITGLTADVMIRVAEIAYKRPPEFEKYASDQIRSPQALVEFFEKQRSKTQGDA